MPYFFKLKTEGQKESQRGSCFKACLLHYVLKWFHLFYSLGNQNGPGRGPAVEAEERLPKPCMVQKNDQQFQSLQWLLLLSCTSLLSSCEASCLLCIVSPQECKKAKGLQVCFLKCNQKRTRHSQLLNRQIKHFSVLTV